MLWAGLLNLILLDFIQAEQRLFEATEGSDTFLARFHVDPTSSSLSSQKILELAETYNLDVWHTTDRVVDIYTSSLPSELQVVPYSLVSVPSAQPPRSSPKSTTGTTTSTTADPPTWNLTSLYTPFHETYHSLDEVYTFFDQLVAQFPDVMRMMEMGRSAEGRRIVGVSVSTGGYGGGGGAERGERGRQLDEEEEEVKQKKSKRKTKKGHRPPLRDTEKLGFVIIGAQHAREWIATSTAIYLAHSLLVNQTEPNSLHKLLDHFDFHFVPVPNPDGYAYTWQIDRYWYKNRQVVGPYTRCVGVDMNRNWGYKWRSTVTNSHSRSNETSSLSRRPDLPADPCSHWYPGSRPFESPEVNSIANWITTLPNLAAFIDLRSYGQMLSSPFSYSCTPTPRDIEDQTEAALGSSQALSSAHGTPYKVGRLCETLYPAPGNMLDWMYVREAVKYAYVVHLRDTGTYGFALPEKWIRPTGEETNRMVNYLAKFIARQANRNF